MVTALAKLFRISLSKGKNIITVADELEHVRNYLTIQKIRYKNKFSYDITAEPETLSCQTIKLIVQPLVENAIYHGWSLWMGMAKSTSAHTERAKTCILTWWTMGSACRKNRPTPC